MTGFIFFIMGCALLYFFMYFASREKLSNKTVGILFFVLVVMLIVIKNALGID